MPLSRFTELELQAMCQVQLGMLELWLRRLIQDRFEYVYANDILHAKHSSGSFIVKKEIRESVRKRIQDRPGRYSRSIDAALLDDLISIICNPQIYRACFVAALICAFPGGADEARTFLHRLAAPRNRLAHHNPISIRQAEQVVCYSNDIVYALREFYEMSGTADEYNVPRILRMWDSFGNVQHTQANAEEGQYFDYSDNPTSYLRPGDTLTIEIEVDPSFWNEGYKIKWGPTYAAFEGDRLKKLILPIENQHVSRKLPIIIQVISNKDWHRLGPYFDDFWVANYRVLPPV